MSACNKRPPPEHPLHRSSVACHLPAGHDGPCPWDPQPSKARRGLDRLLATFPSREVESVDAQLPHPIVVYSVDEHGNRDPHPYRTWDTIAGPWVLVRFVGGDEWAIWKATGAVYRVGPDGAVDEDPILELQS